MRTLTQYLATAPETMCVAAHLFADHSNHGLPTVMVESEVGFLFVRLEGLTHEAATGPDTSYATIRDAVKFELVVTECLRDTVPLTTIPFFAGFKGSHALHHLSVDAHGPTVAALFVLLTEWGGGVEGAWNKHGPIVAQQATQALLGVLESGARPYAGTRERLLLNPSFTGGKTAH